MVTHLPTQMNTYNLKTIKELRKREMSQLRQEDCKFHVTAQCSHCEPGRGEGQGADSQRQCQIQVETEVGGGGGSEGKMQELAAVPGSVRDPGSD